MQSVHENNPLGLLFGNSGCKSNFAVTNIFFKFFFKLFYLHPELPNRKPNGLFSCSDCIYDKNGYIKLCKSFTFKLTNGKSVTWNYDKFFDCNSKDVLYILICNNCDYFYLGKTIDFKQRIRKRKSDVKHSQNSTCRECAEHLRDCAKIEPFFQIYPFYHEKDHYLRDYK